MAWEASGVNSNTTWTLLSSGGRQQLLKGRGWGYKCAPNPGIAIKGVGVVGGALPLARIFLEDWGPSKLIIYHQEVIISL